VAAESGDVVLVAAAGLFNEAVRSQTLQQARNLAAAEGGQEGPQALVLETGYVELASGNYSEQ
jgi:hypothetical protein